MAPTSILERNQEKGPQKVREQGCGKEGTGWGQVLVLIGSRRRRKLAQSESWASLGLSLGIRLHDLMTWFTVPFTPDRSCLRQQERGRRSPSAFLQPTLHVLTLTSSFGKENKAHSPGGHLKPFQKNFWDILSNSFFKWRPLFL